MIRRERIERCRDGQGGYGQRMHKHTQPAGRSDVAVHKRFWDGSENTERERKRGNMRGEGKQ